MDPFPTPTIPVASPPPDVPLPPQSNNKFLLILGGLILLLTLGIGGYSFIKSNSTSQKGCTMEAKLCPDGSSVGRTGPNCEFAPCPNPQPSPTPDLYNESSRSAMANWKTYTNTEIGYTLMYPQEMYPPRTSNDTFVLYDSDAEKERIEKIRSSGQEIGYSLQGMEIGVVIIGKNSNRNSALDAAKESGIATTMEKISLLGYNAYRNTGNNSIELFIDGPNTKILRIWSRFGNMKYKAIFNQILSTFKFLE